MASHIYVVGGQSLALYLCTVTNYIQSPHADTHMWNGSAYVAPVGDGVIAFANMIRTFTQDHVYIVPVAVGGSSILYYGGACWGDTGTGCMFDTACATIQAAMNAVNDPVLESIDWWGGQTEGYSANGGYPDVFNSFMTAQNTLISRFRTAFGTDFRFRIWPVCRVHVNDFTQVCRAQMSIALHPNAAQNGIEPGPASYDLGYYDDVHLYGASENMHMGIRWARCVKSYLVAKANNALTVPHNGWGPYIDRIDRHPNGTTQVFLARIVTKNGFGLIPKNAWSNNDTNWVSGVSAAWTGGATSVPVNSACIAGGYLKVFTNWNLNNPLWIGYMQSRLDNRDTGVYDDNFDGGGWGQPMLPSVMGHLVSA